MSTHIPLLTVGLPVFNGERYLGGAIECILSQSFRDFELIISDNASTDGTEEICQHYARRDRRIRYSRNAVNVGGAQNSDLILDRARTEFFATASHDDYFSLNYLEACLAKLQSTADAVICCPEQVVFLDPRGNPWMSQRNCDTEGREIVARMHELVNRLGWYAYYGITRTEEFRSLLKDMRRYRYAYGGDVILMATALLRGQIVVAPRTTFFYREPDKSKKVATQMEEILPGSKAPARPYTGLARDLLQVVQDSTLSSEVKSEACLEMLKTIANQQGWVNVLAGENAGGGINRLAAGLPPATPVGPWANGKQTRGYGLSKDGSAKPRLVVLVPFPIAPPVSGGEQRIYYLYRSLLSRFDIDLVTVTGPDKPAGQFMLGEGYREIRVAKSRAHLLQEIELNRIAGLSVEDIGMAANIGNTPEYAEVVRKSLAESDCVCLSHPFMLPALQGLWNGPIFYDAHNVELDLKRQILPDSSIRDTLLKTVEQLERVSINRSDLILCCSENDKVRLHELYDAPVDRMVVVPSGYASDNVPFQSMAARRNRIAVEKLPAIALFMSSQHLPDVTAVQRIAALASELPEVQFIVAGTGCHEILNGTELQNVQCIGPISEEDKRRLLATCTVGLNPVERECGSNQTVVECLAAGVPVISTRYGARGLGLVDRRHCWIRDIVDFPTAIRQAIANHDAEDISVMVEQAHRHVEHHFEWSEIGRRFIEEAEMALKIRAEKIQHSAVQSAAVVAGNAPASLGRTRQSALGINVIGHVSGNLGIGVTARSVVRTLIDRGCAVSVLDLDPGLQRGGHDETYRNSTVASWSQLPHAMNLFVLPPTTIAMLYEGSRDMFSGRRLNIAFSMWELPVLPEVCRAALETLDGIVAESEYIRHAFQLNLSGVPISYAPHPLYLPDGIVSDRSRYGLSHDSVVFVTSLESHSDVERKNTRAVIDAFHRSMGEDPRAYLLVKVNNPMEDGQLHPSVTMLRAYAQGHTRIRFITEAFTYEEILRLYAAADVFVSLHRAEGLGLDMMEAMALGKPVIATGWSGNLSFMDHRCACLVGYRLIPANGTLAIYRHENLGAGAVWADPDIGDAAAWMRRLADDAMLRSEIGERARAHMAAFQSRARQGDFVDELEMLWRHKKYKCSGGVGERLVEASTDAPDQLKSAPGGQESKSHSGLRTQNQPHLRILFQNRPTAKSHPGGDTVVMDLLRRELEQMGHHVDVALGPHDLTGYDLVQAFNFATPEVTESYARRAVAANVPLVVAAIYEDWPLFLNKCLAMTEVLRDYLQGGRNEATFGEGVRRVKTVPAATRAENNYTARNAACLLAWSNSEKSRLLSDYPGCRVEVIGLGADHIHPKDVEPSLFQDAYGVKDFVLCVGRLETRKNQLMLLKALQNEPIPIVFLTGGFSYQPNYVKLCQMFRRPAKTLFIDRVSDEMLASAYRAARVLCMPSWYELPGLVALEALRLGCPVVASRWGTLPDYVPHGVEYCEPDDPDDIRAAIVKSYGERGSIDPRELVRGFQWRETAARLVAVYEEVLHRHRRLPRPHSQDESEALEDKCGVAPHVKTSSVPTFDCSVVIPVCNNVESTKKCLTALSTVTRNIQFEVIVVDNHSTDGTQEFLSSLGGDVQIIRNPDNLGFAKACNQGAHAARGKYIVFLRSDVVPQDDWLRALVGEVEGYPEVGVVGSKLLCGDGTVQHAGVVFSRSQLSPYHIYRQAPADLPVVNVRREFQVVTGACLLIRRALFDEIGGFDQGFCNGFEDVDLCLKVREKGYRVVYQPRSVLYSLESQTSDRKRPSDGDSARLRERWGSHWWLADEDLHYHADGYKLIGSEATGEYLSDVQLLRDIKERAAWAHVAAAQAAAQKRDWNGVKRELGLAEDWPRDPYVLSWAAMVCEKLGEQILQQSFLVLYLELKESPAVRLALARALLTRKDLVAADRHLTKLLKSAPTDAEGLLLQGVLCMQREQFREAEMAFSSALEQGADRRKCLMGMGMASLGRAYTQGAWEQFLLVLAEHPDDAEAVHWLLRAGTAQNRWDELSRHLRGYVSRNPNDLAVRFALAGVLVRADRIDEARRQHDTLRSLAPEYDGLAELGRVIAGKETVLAMEVANGG
jgi:GT2 family glycosyltransferase/glycosyltransferase involved in cell wall biosynthesis/Flp pilus assembly protein TadD